MGHNVIEQPGSLAGVPSSAISFYLLSYLIVLGQHQETNKNLTGLINVWYLIPVLEYVLRSLTVLLHLLINYYKMSKGV
jgi:hypothetical protein